MAKFLDVLLSSIGIFFVTFCWSYYLLRDGKSALWCAFIVGVCASYIVYKIVCRSFEKSSAKQNNKKKIASFTSYLCFCENIGNVCAELLKYYTFDIKKVQNDGIVATKSGFSYYVALLFDNDFVSVADTRRCVRKAKGAKADKLLVFCIGVKPTESQLANGEMSAKFVDVATLYTLFEQADKLPALDKTAVKKSAYFAQFAFSKKRFGGYFASGMFLLVTSALTFFPLYSIVWGTALLGLALYSLLNKKYNVVESVATLE